LCAIEADVVLQEPTQELGALVGRTPPRVRRNARELERLSAEAGRTFAWGMLDRGDVHDASPTSAAHIRNSSRSDSSAARSGSSARAGMCR